MNKTVIIGNLGQDAQVRQTQDGKSFLSFSVAVSEKRGDQSQTTWFSCSAWGERFVNGRLVEFLKSGTKVYIEGKYAPSIFSRQDGSMDISHNLMVNQVELLSAAAQAPVAQALAGQGHPQAPAPNSMNPHNVGMPSQPQISEDDDLPF